MTPCHFLNGLEIKGDGKWLVDAFERGSLIVCHDGSYMPDEDDTRCSAAVLFLCKATGNLASVTYCEKTVPDVTSNYRGELIGGLAATIVFRALSMLTTPATQRPYEIFCDNMGVVLHGNSRHKPLPEKQAQVDLLLRLRHNLELLKLEIRYVHVYGHLDEQLRFISSLCHSNLT
jgi:hypothetical protein